MTAREHNYADVVDEFGASCPECRCAAFPTKAETGPKIGVRFSFECIAGHKFQATKPAVTP